jgi:pimeloyl-ACP methyl ester carboxylesterase
MRKLLITAVVAVAFAATPARSRALCHVEGKASHGALYGIWVPENWNGDLVLYAHGFRNPNCPLAVPTDPQLLPTATCPDPESGTMPTVKTVRDTLLSYGYAFAASSYSQTGFALKQGVRETLQLEKIFSKRFGRPRRTYLYGHSMGSAIALNIAEQHPEAFDGALAMCGMIGGSPAEFQYIIDARATFDALFPGVVPGSVASVPPHLTFYGDVAPAVLALFDPANPDLVPNFGRAATWASSDQVAFPFATAAELVNGMLEALYLQTLGLPGLVAQARGFPATNQSVAYSWSPSAVSLFSVDVAAVNSAVKRVTGDPQALAWATQWYDTTGAISFPVLTVHTIRDAAVPIAHEQIYADKVAAAGRSRLLVQRTVSHDPRTEPPDGHCTFKVEEELASLADLLQWVDSGIRPAGGDATFSEPSPAPAPSFGPHEMSLPARDTSRSDRCSDSESDEGDRSTSECHDGCEERARHPRRADAAEE